MARLSIQKLIDEDIRWLAQQTVKTQLAMLEHYRDTLREIYDTIESYPVESLKHQHLLQLQAQLEQTVNGLTNRLTTTLSGHTVDMFDAQANRQLQNWVKLEQALGDPSIAAMFQTITPILPREAVQVLLVTQRVNIRRFAAEINDQITRELAKSVTKGESISQAVKRLRQVIPIKPSDGRRQHTARLELISRMEISKAQNQANIEIVGKINERFPKLDLWYRVHESIDRSKGTRNHPLSWAIHELKRNASKKEPFVIPLASVRRIYGEYQGVTGRRLRPESSGILWDRKGDHFQGLALPAHYNDRGVILPWRPGWVT